MPRHVFILFLAWIVPALVEVRADSWSGKSVDFSHGDLCVSPNGRFCNIPMELRFSIWEIRLGS